MKSLNINFKSQRALPFVMALTLGLYASVSFNAVEMHAMSYLTLAAMLAVSALTALLTARQHVIRRLDLLVMLYWGLVLAVSLTSDADLKEGVYNALAACLLVLTFGYYDDKIPAMLCGLLCAFSIAAYAQLFQLVANPSLWLIPDTSTATGYLLGGNYNQIGPRLMAALFTNIMCLRLSRWFWINLVPLFVSETAILMMAQSRTSLTCIILFALICLIPMLRLQRKAVWCVLAAAVAFEVLVCFNGKGFENNGLVRWFLIDVLNKDVTFTGRTFLWDAATGVFMKSPLIGYGFVTGEWYLTHMSSSAIGPHNFVMNVMIQGGLMSLTIYIGILFMSMSRAAAWHDKYANIVLAAIAVLCVMMLMEVYNMFFILYFCTMAYHYGAFCKAMQTGNR